MKNFYNSIYDFTWSPWNKTILRSKFTKFPQKFLKYNLNMENYAIRGNPANRIKSTQAIAAVEKAMKKYGIPKPPKGQRSRLHHDLPSMPEEKEGIKILTMQVICYFSSQICFVFTITSRSIEEIQIFKSSFQSC